MLLKAKNYIYVCLIVILANFAMQGKCLPTELADTDYKDDHHVEVEELAQSVPATQPMELEMAEMTSDTVDMSDNDKNEHVAEELNENEQGVAVEQTTVTMDEKDSEESSGQETTPVEKEEDDDVQSTTLKNVCEEEQSEEEQEPQVTTADNEEVEEMTATTLAPTCDTAGVKAHETDCHLYYSCAAKDSSDGPMYLETLSCGTFEAFNEKWSRCARDLSSCAANEVTCLVSGSLPDPSSNTSYYLCYPRLESAGFLLYHVKCAVGEVYVPALGKCFIDLSDFENAYLNYDWTQVHDLDVVKAEYKEYKAEVKLQMKLEKEKAKLEKKLQKELEKEAKKKAKEEAKAKKEAEKLAAAA